MQDLQAQASLNTELKDRILWFDGDSTITAPSMEARISSSQFIDGFFVEEINKALQQYNHFYPKDQQIQVKDSVRQLTYEWNIPIEYAELNVSQYVFELLTKQLTYLDTSIAEKAVHRVTKELELYKKYGFLPLLRALIFIINTLQSNNVVYGVGRGSSVSSYVLYLIGVHDVDSLEYSLNIEDFLHD